MRICEIKGCNEKHRTKGLCKKHYDRQWRQEHKKYMVEYLKQYQQDNREQILKQKKQFYQEHKEQYAKYNKQRYQEHKEEITKSHKQWQINNPEYYKQYRIDNKDKTKQYYINNKERIKKYQKQYWQTSKGKAVAKAHNHNRRILTKGLTAAIVQSVYADNIKKYGVLTCYLCFKPITENDDSLDHLTPLIREGSNDYSNLGVAHRICNSKKGVMTLEEWQIQKEELESKIS